MDPRTRIILFRLLGRKIISSINGCVSTGKEANVYHGTSEAHGQCAVKVVLLMSNLLTASFSSSSIDSAIQFKSVKTRSLI